MGCAAGNIFYDFGGSRAHIEARKRVALKVCFSELSARWGVRMCMTGADIELVIN